MGADDSTLVCDRLVADVPERLWRTAGALWFAGALVFRFLYHPAFSAPVWWLETLIPAAILAAYLTREPPFRPARGFAAVVLPFAAAGMPFLFLVPPYTPFARAHLDLFALLLAPPTLWMIASYLALRRSYALMAEARALVTHGPYAWMRHPVYVAQALCGAVVVSFRFSLITLAVYLAFLAVQRARLEAEEAALAEAHGDQWITYAARVGRYWPRWKPS